MPTRNPPELDTTRALRNEPHFVTEDDMLRTTITALALTAGLGLSACGGDSDADAVRHTIRAFHDAAFSGDEHGCGLLTAHARGQFTGQQAFPATCKDAIDQVGALASDAERDALARVRIRRVIFAENHAKAIIEDGDVMVPEGLTPDLNDRPTILVKRDGRWLIEDLG